MRTRPVLHEAENEVEAKTLAFLAVFVYATHATQSVALRALRLAGNRASRCQLTAVINILY